MNVHTPTGAAAALVAAAVTCLPLHAQVVFREGFETPKHKWQAYRSKPTQATFETVAGDAADGGKFLRVACPGRLKLEGVYTSVRGAKAHTLYTMRAKLRGKGDVWGMMLSSNGWLYAKQTVALTGQWQTLTLSKLTGAKGGLSIYFVTKTEHQARFDLDAVEVVKEADPPAGDAGVGPLRLEAEDYAVSSSYVVKDADALAGRALRAPSYLGPRNMPFPLTTRPVFVYLRLRPGAPKDSVNLCARIEGYQQLLATAKPARPSGWQWVRLDVPKPAAARGSVDIALRQPKRGLAPALVDSVVIASDGKLRPEQLAAARLALSGRPLIAVGRCPSPPLIDGRPDDACWAECIAVRDFNLIGRDAAPTQKTTARLCYDATNLYVTFTCLEYVLQPEANQLHAFRDRETERDSNVWDDDSVAVILGPTAQGPYFDVFANARGTVNDARLRLPDIWQSRDPSWNGDVEVAGRKGDGSWGVEMRIGLASMAAAEPKPGECWRLCLGRIAKHAKETSAWNPVVRGFHVADTLGTLTFRPHVGGLDLSVPGKIVGGPNVLRATRAETASAVCLGAAIEEGPATGARSRTLAMPGKQAEVVCHVTGQAKVKLSCNVLDAATLDPLYLSPVLERTVTASDATLCLATAAGYAVYHNGVRVASGANADGSQAIKVALQAGVNAFAFQVESGRVAAAIDVPGQRVVSDTAWRYAPGEPKDFASATFNDSKWAKAKLYAKAKSTLGHEVGGDGPGVVRRVVWFEETYLWPTPEPAQHVPQNAAQHLTFSANGMAGRVLDGFKLSLAVPRHFEVIGSAGYYGRTRDEKAEFIMAGMKEAKRNGQPVRVYEVRADKPIKRRAKVRILELLNVFVRYVGPATPEEEYEFEFWTEAEGGSITECPQRVPVRVTPALRGKQPKRMVWQIWGSFFGCMDDPEMKKALLDTMCKAGFNNLVSGKREDAELGHAVGITNTSGINFEPWSLDRRGYLGEHPEDALLDAQGKRSAKYVCTGALLGRGWPSVEAKLRERIERDRPHIVDWDYESSPFTSYLSCYCNRCLAEFRKHAGLADDVELDPKTMRDHHGAAWIDFMTTRNAQLAKRFKEVAHACGAHFSMYSGYHSSETRVTYGVDWSKIGKLEAADHVGCGYGRRREHVDATIDALDGIPLVVGAILRPYDRNLRERVVPMTKARLLRRLADSTGGVLVYDRMPLGGRSWLAIAEVTRLCADYEELFLRGERTWDAVEVQPAGETESAVKRLGKTALVLLMNAGAKPKTFTVTVKPGAARSGTLYYAARAVRASEATTVVLSPGDAEAIVMERR